MQVLTGLLAVVGGVPQWLGKVFKESPPLKWAALALVVGAVVTITAKEGISIWRDYWEAVKARAEAHGKNYNMERDTKYCNFTASEKANYAKSMARFGRHEQPPKCE